MQIRFSFEVLFSCGSWKFISDDSCRYANWTADLLTLNTSILEIAGATYKQVFVSQLFVFANLVLSNFLYLKYQITSTKAKDNYSYMM